MSSLFQAYNLHNLAMFLLKCNELYTRLMLKKKQKKKNIGVIRCNER